MISAGIASVQRRGSEAADAIRLQPFTAKALVQISKVHAVWLAREYTDRFHRLISIRNRILI
jgi:hypothetical protein